MEATELILSMEADEASMTSPFPGLYEVEREPGTNGIGMVAWKLLLRTPVYPEGRVVMLISNDITTVAGSFGANEDLLFDLVTKYAQRDGVPRLYFAANSGARFGLAEDVRSAFDVKWTDASDPTRGFKHLHLSDADTARIGSAVMTSKNGNGQNEITTIIGKKEGLGVENLRGSGNIAGSTSRAYNSVFTLTYCSGRCVGIGAYLVRLGQRTIQKETRAPILLTGHGALNRLIGREVYTSNAQIGGPGVMFQNGVSHLTVKHDLAGVRATLKWLSYVPAAGGPNGAIDGVCAIPKLLGGTDPVERAVGWAPSPTPYDPRNLFTGEVDAASGKWTSGFFDRGSFEEYLSGWAKSVIIGRARLGGLPMGVVVSEVRSVESITPADPAAPESSEVKVQQAGQVWFPDSAYKTAQAIRDFQREGLPLLVLANWRGFSGGQRDMFDEVLKFGAFIVDALVGYTQPVFIYLPPFAELRGGA